MCKDAVGIVVMINSAMTDEKLAVKCDHVYERYRGRY